MKVLLVSPNFYPEKTGIGVTATDCARFISNFENSVTVVTTMPYYPEWKIHQEYRGKLFAKEDFEDIRVDRVWLYVPERASTLRRIVQELSFGILSSLCMIAKRFDVLLCITPPLSSGVVAAIVALLRRKPFWVYIKDIQPDAAICLGMLSNPLVIRFSRWMEAFIYARAEKILVLSDGMRRNLLEKQIADEKIVIVPDSIEVHELSVDLENRSEGVFRQQNSLQSKFLVLYSGNIGVKHNPEIIVECAKVLAEHKDIFFAVVGEGVLKERLASMIQEYQLENVGLFPLCDRALLGDMLSSADVLLAPQREEVLDIVVPSKLLAYLTSKRPVVASVHEESEAATVLRQNKAGVLSPPEDVDAMAKQILFLKDHPDEADAIGQRGFALVRDRYEHQVVKEQCYAPLFRQSDS